MLWFKASWVYGGLSEYGDLGIIGGEIPPSQSHVTGPTWHDLVGVSSRATGSSSSFRGLPFLGLESQETSRVFSPCPRPEIYRAECGFLTPERASLHT